MRQDPNGEGNRHPKAEGLGIIHDPIDSVGFCDVEPVRLCLWLIR